MKNKKYTLHRIFILFLGAFAFSTTGYSISPICGKASFTDTSLLQLSERLLYNVKTEASTSEIEATLSAISRKKLLKSLSDDNAKKTFWINMYNAWYQLLATKEKMKSPGIFNERKIPIAGILFSLEEIEQGILRNDLQWLEKRVVKEKKLIQKAAVSKMDYRIHFALNCGAKSCPPIAFYSFANIDKQLDIATRSFLRNNTIIDDTRKQVTVTQLMEWYSNDFGGEEGIRAIIKKVMQKDVTNYSILFSEYDWEEDLQNFTDWNK